jgi:hypothetical protein
MINGDLFREAEREIRRQLEASFWQTPFGQFVHRFHGTGRIGYAEVLRIAEQVGGFRDYAPSILQELRLIERYAAFDYRRYLQQFLKQLGPAGRLLEVIVSGLTKEGRLDAVQVAVELLRAFGFEVLPRPGLPLSPQERRRAIQAAQQFLDWAAQFQPIPERRPVQPAKTAERAIETKRTAAAQGEYVVVPFATGGRQFPSDHPLVTGEMVQVDSKNVHSIGYDLNTNTLYVRFLVEHVREGYVHRYPGALYGYRNVTPDEFLDFLSAPSKGGWVWDHLRIRGTVSGHQKDYFLAGVARGYVPRKATLQWIKHPKTGKPYLAEVFAPRTVILGGAHVTSQLPLEVVQVFKVVKPPRPELRPLLGLS